MAIEHTPRLGLTQWTDPNLLDPVHPDQFNADAAALDDLAAIAVQGTAAERPAFGVRGRLYYATDTGDLTYDTGTAWTAVGATDAAVAGFVEDPASQTNAALSATIATEIGGTVAPYSLPQGTTALCLGDSHMAGSGSSNVVFSVSAIASRVAGSEALSVIRAGYGGERSDQLLARLPDLLDQNEPGQVWVLCGTNDAGQGVAPSTFIDNIDAMKVITETHGIPFKIGLVPPNGASATAPAAPDRLRLVRAYNLSIRRWAQRNAVEVIDTYSAVVNPATGYMNEIYNSGDHIHFNNAGHAAMGLAAAKVLANNAVTPPWPVTAKGVGLLPNPLNDPALGGWSAIAGTPDPTSGFVAAVDGEGVTAGGWFQLDKDNSGGASDVGIIRAQNIDMTGVEEGDVLVCYARYKVTGGATATLRVLRGSSSIALPVDSADRTPLSGTIFEYTVQAADIGQTMRWGFSMAVPVGASGSVAVAQIDVFNKSDLGVI